MDFFSSIDPDVLSEVLQEAIVPIAVEYLWSISPLPQLEEQLKSICSILGTVDTINTFIISLGNLGQTIIDGVIDEIDFGGILDIVSKTDKFLFFLALPFLCHS